MVAAAAACTRTQARPDPVTLAPIPVASSAPQTLTAPPKSYALAFPPGPPGAWHGSHGDAPMSVTGIWGASRDVFAVGSRGLLHSDDGGVRWTVSTDLRGAAVWGSSADDVYLGGDGVKRSTDRGVTFHDVGGVPGAVMALGGTASNVFAAGIGFVARSTDHGATWEPIQTGFREATYYAVVSAPPEIYVTGLRHEPQPSSPIGYHTVPILMRTADGGRTWTQLAAPKPGMTDNEESRGLCFTRSGAMFVAMSYSVYSSRDRGATWSLAVGVGAEVLGVACRGSEVIAVGRNKHFHDSTDDGASWHAEGLDAALSGPELIALQAVFFGPNATYVGGEAYTKEPAGTLLRRAD